MVYHLDIPSLPSEPVDVDMMFSLLTLASLATVAFAASRTSALSGCITVGSGGTYSTVRMEMARLQPLSRPVLQISIELLSMTDDMC